jgi:DNA-binding GntR family transcriptional regulator
MKKELDNKSGPSLTSKVFQHIREGIIEGRYKTGDNLVETKLAEELGVSRTPIREALKQLELEDLAVSIPNRGVIVKGFSHEDISDNFTIRYLLDSLAAYWAAERIQPAALERLSELIELMELYTRRADSAQLANLDTEFHEIIATAASSRTLKHILGSLHQHAYHARQNSLTSPTRPVQSLNEHKEIYAALLARDAEHAKRCMEKHVRTAGNMKVRI